MRERSAWVNKPNYFTTTFARDEPILLYNPGEKMYLVYTSAFI
jgi:hypothetical protein